MGNEFKDFEMETPSLTLEPDLGELEKKEEVIPQKQLQKEEVPVLTPEEQKMVNDFAAIHFLTKSLVKEFEPKGITVNAIAPGFIQTPWHENRTPESYERINGKIALHRYGEIKDVVDVAYSTLTNTYKDGSIMHIHVG